MRRICDYVSAADTIDEAQAIARLHEAFVAVEIQVTHVGPDLQFATAEVAKSTAEGSGSSSDGPSAATSAEEKSP